MVDQSSNITDKSAIGVGSGFDIKKIEELVLELKQNYTVVIVTNNLRQAARISIKTAFFLLDKVVEYGEMEK